MQREWNREQRVEEVIGLTGHCCTHNMKCVMHLLTFQFCKQFIVLHEFINNITSLAALVAIHDVMSTRFVA